MKKRTQKVYGLYDGFRRKPFYVGRTVRSLPTRLGEHLDDEANTPKTRYIRRGRKGRIRIKLIEESTPKKIRGREQHWINRYKPHLTNVKGMGKRKSKKMRPTTPHVPREAYLLLAVISLILAILSQ